MTHVATRSFTSSKFGAFKEGQKVDVPADAINAWKKSGLIREGKEPDRPLDAGRKSPASRPARVSRPTTANESENGETQGQGEPSLSSTARSDSQDGPTSSTQPTHNGGETTT